MLNRLVSLPSWNSEPRDAAAATEAQALLSLVPHGIHNLSREFSRCLESAARLRVSLPSHVVDEAQAALATGLEQYSQRDIQAVITAIAKLFPGTTHFNSGIEQVAKNLLRQSETITSTARFQATLLWAFSRIGFQCESLDALIVAYCSNFAREV